MKTTIICEDGNVQIDFVPETKHEEIVLSMFEKGALLRVGMGVRKEECKGGYITDFDDRRTRSFTFITSITNCSEIK